MVRGLSQRPNLTEGPAATWDFRRSIKEEEEEEISILINLLKFVWKLHLSTKLFQAKPDIFGPEFVPIETLPWTTSTICTATRAAPRPAGRRGSWIGPRVRVWYENFRKSSVSDVRAGNALVMIKVAWQFRPRRFRRGRLTSRGSDAGFYNMSSPPRENLTTSGKVVP
jgi:hypothetical protein